MTTRAETGGNNHSVDDSRVRVRRFAPTQKIAVSIVFIAATFMTVLDSTIVNVTLPAVGRRFGVPSSHTGSVAVWYLVSLAIFIPVSGWLGDRFGTKRTFLFAVATFSVASALAGAAQSLWELDVCRVLQGAGGGLLVPVGLAMLFRTFPVSERLRASRILMIPTSVAPALGPVLGGLLVDNASWRWIFYVNVPIGLAAFMFGLRTLTESKHPGPGRFDAAGFVLSAVALSLLLYALTTASSSGWLSVPIVACLVTAPILLIALVVVELRKADPMIDVRLFSTPLFRNSSSAMFFETAGFIGTLYVMAQLLQAGLGMSALAAGLNIFPEAIGIILGAQVSTRLYRFVGPRALITAGSVGAAASIGLLSLVGATSDLWLVRLAMVSVGLFASTVFVPAQTTAFVKVSLHSTGQASMLYSTQRQLGAAMGVAVLTAILSAMQPHGSTGATSVVAYHVAFLVAAGIVLLGLVGSLGIRNEHLRASATAVADAHAI